VITMEHRDLRLFKAEVSIVLRSPRFPHRLMIQSILKNHLIEVLDASNVYVTAFAPIALTNRDDMVPTVTKKYDALYVEGYVYLASYQDFRPAVVENLAIHSIKEVGPEELRTGNTVNAAIFTGRDHEVTYGPWVIKKGRYYFVKVCSVAKCSIIPVTPSIKMLNRNIPETVPTPHFYDLQNRPLFQYPPPNVGTLKLLEGLATGDLKPYNFEDASITVALKGKKRKRKGRGGRSPKRQNTY